MKNAILAFYNHYLKDFRILEWIGFIISVGGGTGLTTYAATLDWEATKKAALVAALGTAAAFFRNPKARPWAEKETPQPPAS